jgi:hypothetical protein
MAKTGAFFAQFFYRVNRDMTIESICGFCFMASAATVDQAQLQVWETAHPCAGYSCDQAPVFLSRQSCPLATGAGKRAESPSGSPLRNRRTVRSLLSCWCDGAHEGLTLLCLRRRREALFAARSFSVRRTA